MRMVASSASSFSIFSPAGVTADGFRVTVLRVLVSSSSIGVSAGAGAAGAIFTPETGATEGCSATVLRVVVSSPSAGAGAAAGTTFTPETGATEGRNTTVLREEVLAPSRLMPTGAAGLSITVLRVCVFSPEGETGVTVVVVVTPVP